MIDAGSEVKVCMNSKWTAVCHRSEKLSEMTAKVVCRELGFSPKGETTGNLTESRVI